MILLADGGSTKVDWCLVDHGVLKKRVFTKGANPFHRTTEDISNEISLSLVPELKNDIIDSVYFYGAGCAFPEKNELIKSAIADNIHAGNIQIDSDLLGTAVGLWGDKPGIACILGTGSNSCFYDGKRIVQHVSPLGFMLGDEGSGAVLGRLFMGSCLKNQFSPAIKEDFLKYINLSVAQILEKVYKQSMPSRFMASVCPFIKDNLHEPSIHDLVYNAFEDFFRKNVMQYDYKNHQVSFAGSVAFHFQDVLREVASSLHIEIAEIVQSPMDGLIKYYSK
ncbi:MAG: ATPase [Paludibacter sp.]|nr:ATPase [Paludibacter sp.]